MDTRNPFDNDAPCPYKRGDTVWSYDALADDGSAIRIEPHTVAEIVHRDRMVYVVTVGGSMRPAWHFHPTEQEATAALTSWAERELAKVERRFTAIVALVNRLRTEPVAPTPVVDTVPLTRREFAEAAA